MSKKQKLNTAYQKHLDLLKAFGIFLLAVSLITVIIIAKLLADENYTETLYYVLAVAVYLFIGGIIVSVYSSFAQNTADAINENLYAVWKYKPQTIFTFYRKMCRYQKKTAFVNYCLVGILVLILGIIMFFNTAGHYLGIVAIVIACAIFICAIYNLPYVKYLLLRIKTSLLGDAKEIIFSRSGIWYCGKVYYFGDKAITYHRVERKELHGQDVIVFYYTKTRGFQQTPMELAIPVAPKMAYAADALVAEFNRSDLLENLKEKGKL